MSTKMGRTTINAILIQDRMRALVNEHGGTRKLAKVLKIDSGYVSRLCRGAKTNPSDMLLKRMGLIRSIIYIDEGSHDV
jgi:hypothetical protein